jgi:hypothetical protein
MVRFSNIYIMNTYHHVSPHTTYVLVSPKAQTPNSSSEIPITSLASASFLGGSSTGSNAIFHVPQCIPIAFFAFLHQPRSSSGEQRLTRSLNILTASMGALWMGDIWNRGAYAPMGIRARSNGPNRLPISLNAGQTGKDVSSL